MTNEEKQLQEDRIKRADHILSIIKELNNAQELLSDSVNALEVKDYVIRINKVGYNNCDAVLFDYALTKESIKHIYSKLREELLVLVNSNLKRLQNELEQV